MAKFYYEETVDVEIDEDEIIDWLEDHGYVVTKEPEAKKGCCQTANQAKAREIADFLAECNKYILRETLTAYLGIPYFTDEDTIINELGKRL